MSFPIKNNEFSHWNNEFSHEKFGDFPLEYGE